MADHFSSVLGKAHQQPHRPRLQPGGRSVSRNLTGTPDQRARRRFEALSWLGVPCAILSEIFRVFQSRFRTSWTSSGYRKPAVRHVQEDDGLLPCRLHANQRRKEDMDDRRFWTVAVWKTKRLVGNLSGRAGCRRRGPSAGLHFIWMGYSPLDRRRSPGPHAAEHGGTATYILGVLLHFFIAFSAAAIYYAASRRLAFLTEHALVCGIFYGVAVELVMRLVVLPLSALHARGPYELRDMILGLLVHMVTVGLPISFSVRWFGPIDKRPLSSISTQPASYQSSSSSL